MNSQPANGDDDKCVEHGIWTPVPVQPPISPKAFELDFSAIDPEENERVKEAGVLTFHAAGCTGDFADHTAQDEVAAAMISQLSAPRPGSAGHGEPPAPSFLFHLGDIVYKEDGDSAMDEVDAAEPPVSADQKQMYNAQFFQPYTAYGRCIFSIAGNHDGKDSSNPDTSAIQHYLMNFCASSQVPSPDNTTDGRNAMIQPYVYWRLETPLAHIIGLYSNIANAGILDDPAHPDNNTQYEWLVGQLEHVRQKNAQSSTRKALLLAVHYPPYSGAANFEQRGNPLLGWMKGKHGAGPVHPPAARPLGAVLQNAFAESGQRPDAVISAHAHLYQRLTYRYRDGWDVPYLIAGSGGHSPVEKLWKECGGGDVTPKALPFDAVLPPNLTLPDGDQVQVAAYNDTDGNFGFLRLAVTTSTLTGEFFTAVNGTPALYDSFSLDLKEHTIQ